MATKSTSNSQKPLELIVDGAITTEEVGSPLIRAINASDNYALEPVTKKITSDPNLTCYSLTNETFFTSFTKAKIAKAHDLAVKALEHEWVKPFNDYLTNHPFIPNNSPNPTLWQSIKEEFRYGYHNIKNEFVKNGFMLWYSDIPIAGKEISKAIKEGITSIMDYAAVTKLNSKLPNFLFKYILSEKAQMYLRSHPKIKDDNTFLVEVDRNHISKMQPLITAIRQEYKPYGINIDVKAI